MARRLTKVDELTLPDHYRLESTDDCYFIGEYTARGGYEHGETNDLILNLKKGMEKRDRPYEWRWKVRAIKTCTVQLREVLPADVLTNATFVPVPPSKVKTDPLYDDRIVQIFSKLGDEVDVRELVNLIANHAPFHEAERRLSPDELYELYEIDNELLEPRPVSLVVADDVLTTGASFKAMKRVLSETFPGVPVIGVFVARRVPERLIHDPLE
jgi:predicted amidophosphoribosyltransferase